MTETIQLQMDKMVFGGSCLGRREDGKAVFVPYTLPGELVSVEIIEEYKGHAVGRLLEVLQSSAERIEPKCKHYMACGGCQYQHIPYQQQLDYKQKIFTDQLIRLAGIQDPPVQPILPSKQSWKYRSRAQFHQAFDGSLGFHSSGGEEVILIEECPLLNSGIEQTWPQLDMELIPELNRIEIRANQDDQVMIVFQSEDPLPPEMELDLDSAVVHLGPQGPLVMADSLSMNFLIAGKDFQVSAPSFFQVNLAGAEVLVSLLLDTLQLHPEDTLYDVFCGVGLFSWFLAPGVKELIAIESSEAACEDLLVNLETCENVSLYQADAAEVIDQIEARPDILLVDPPRAGLSRKLRDKIIALSPETIAYISCDAATLARDLKRLVEAGYRLESSTPVDMFPQTSHIESLSILKR